MTRHKTFELHLLLVTHKGSFTPNCGKGNYFCFKNGQHWFLWKCSHGDLQQRQRQRCHHQLGSMPNCGGNGNDTVSFAIATAQYEQALIGWNWGFFVTFRGIFPCEVRLKPCEVRLKWTLENSEKPQIPFWVEGTFGYYIWSAYLHQV